MAKKKGLGRGLEALIEGLDEDLSLSGSLFEVSLDKIASNPFQPRVTFKEKDLRALAESIKNKGVLAPLMVRRLDSGQYELIAGERRLRAARAAGLTSVPVIVREATRAELLEIALIENLHREDLDPIEEAEAYRRLMEEFSRTQQEVADLTGRDRSTTANLLRLLNLPEAVQQDVRQGRLSIGHARALLALERPKIILEVREKILKENLSVRQTEALVKKILKPPPSKQIIKPDELYFQALAEQLTRKLGAKVNLYRKGKQGRIEITFSSDEELERLLKFFRAGEG
ncbi:MAG: ParB/RepB/Spo0J family partition protein [Deltaproteobacteria bacterium]|nr:ParB/RepB/Spo0J family partition protein [Deltaproteobacteria bacterium]